MPSTRRFVVVGLGTFGSSVARQLSKNGCRVTAIDQDRDRVEAHQDDVYEALIGDATDREAMEPLDLADAEAVIVSLGRELSVSLLATLHAKELGAKRIVAKGVSDDHAKILRQLGVEQVIFPKADVGKTLADRLTWPNILDFLPIAPEYILVEVEVGETLNQKTLREADIRRTYGVMVLGIKDATTGKLEFLPDSDFQMNTGQQLVVIGRADKLEGIRELG